MKKLALIVSAVFLIPLQTTSAQVVRLSTGIGAQTLASNEGKRTWDMGPAASFMMDVPVSENGSLRLFASLSRHSMKGDLVLVSTRNEIISQYQGGRLTASAARVGYSHSIETEFGVRPYGGFAVGLHRFDVAELQSGGSKFEIHSPSLTSESAVAIAIHGGFEYQTSSGLKPFLEWTASRSFSKPENLSLVEARVGLILIGGMK